MARQLPEVEGMVQQLPEAVAAELGVGKEPQWLAGKGRVVVEGKDCWG